MFTILELWKKRVKIVEIGKREFYFVLQTETISRVFRNVNRANSEVVSLLLTSSPLHIGCVCACVRREKCGLAVVVVGGGGGGE
ncbi:Heat shockprotein [Trichinella spiralis]|uniref:Heat shockprotein n=1 Tax=Trichinella spiralis TaxID=6334 RepID=A0ABR3K5V9_TRISP